MGKKLYWYRIKSDIECYIRTRLTFVFFLSISMIHCIIQAKYIVCVSVSFGCVTNHPKFQWVKITNNHAFSWQICKLTILSGFNWLFFWFCMGALNLWSATEPSEMRPASSLGHSQLRQLGYVGPGPRVSYHLWVWAVSHDACSEF